MKNLYKSFFQRFLLFILSTLMAYLERRAMNLVFRIYELRVNCLHLNVVSNDLKKTVNLYPIKFLDVITSVITYILI